MGGFAGETASFDFFEADDAVFGGVDGEVAAHVGTVTSLLGRAGLANQDFAGADFLAAKTLDAEALTGVVVDVFRGSTCFDM